MKLHLYNSLSKQKEVFQSIKEKNVGLYTCGPTVYNYAHLGNLRTYIFEDILKRVLIANDYEVKHVMNITDVGHLTSDADTGEDKIEKKAEQEKKTAWDLAQYYTDEFKKDLKDLNILSPDIWPRATETIKDQIELIKKLEEKKFTYIIEDGVYFDTSKLKTYGQLSTLQKDKIKPGARVEMGGKKNPTDFALWKFSPQNSKRQMEWESPWGIGFPGWHTECVAMSMKNLGIPFDIHCGGIDHLSVHHPNEIAQAEAVFNSPLANYWLHGEFLVSGEDKMAKSENNFITLKTLRQKEFTLLAYRYLCLTTHYRSKLTFSWEGLKAAQNALHKIYESISGWQKSEKPNDSFQKMFLSAINNNLDTPKAIALTWELIDSSLTSEEKLSTLFEFDKVLGLNLEDVWKDSKEIPPEIKKMVSQREKARQKKDWALADQLRQKIKNLGYLVEDTSTNTTIIKKIYH